ncbi:phospholipid/cholesterol/gamma-HCH transport system substrate-binding protein [Prauserella flava]|uniref:Phospholipid/cholesterol/gamma-HCH transport system substrate-binding protein n=2 Tax=Prauserella salsuginis group TaxID=2893672 RepID=A0A839XN84_9PSEU|nr:phospholipid/cholesterol/gamma-HCH transport system substrate-binding protein [Prauserella sediminis]MCR3719864.1 phospholipid/cholesterol/gamma-HCH transport system substrate-binding protein [Prauserella flava]MCR3736593.1 phospholipid/cholesterol/gamma-HCH transport system substrate-binding protein [Prauserella salsuginis]
MKFRKLLSAGAAATMLAVSGCGFSGVYDLPLPGGADLGDDPYRVKVQFRDVLDLVPQSGVKVNEVSVGRVEQIGLARDGWTAEVTLLINNDVELPANAIANLRQSSLLGEKYVQLSPPGQDPAEAELAEGDTIPVERTDRSVEVEEVLGALSMLLNGGGVEQLNNITKELNTALSGNEQDVKGLLRNANQLVSALDAQSGDITSALDGLNRLSMNLKGQKDRIAGAIDNLGPGLEVLEQQRGQLVTMLQALNRVSGVATRTINQSQEDLVANLKSLMPVLRKLGEAGSDLPKALELMLSYPFTDQAVKGAKGDYFNLYVDLDLDLQEVLANLGRSRQNPLQDASLPGNLTSPREGTGDNPPPLPLGESSGQPGSQQSGGQDGRTSQQSSSGVEGIFESLSGGGS